MNRFPVGHPRKKGSCRDEFWRMEISANVERTVDPVSNLQPGPPSEGPTPGIKYMFIEENLFIVSCSRGSREEKWQASMCGTFRSTSL